MWPFTSRRIFGNRWWAVAFVAFVCWQVADTFSGAPSKQPAVQSGAASAPVDDAQMNAMVETLNTVENMNR